jgi:H+/Cl- antiporter ClcA
VPDEAAIEVDPSETLRSRAFVQLLVLAAIIGFVVSLLAWGFLETVHLADQWAFTKLPGELGLSTVPTWWPIPILVISGVIVAVAVVRLPGGGGHLPFLGLATKPTMPMAVPGVLIAGFATLAFGAVLGPEMPLLAAGGGLAIFAIRRLRADAPDPVVTVIAAAGSFAALSFIFGSPVIAAVIIIEAAGLGGPRAPLVLLPGLIAAGIGSLTYLGVKSWSGVDTSSYAITPVSLPPFGSPSFGNFAWAIVFGLLCAVLVFAIVHLASGLYEKAKDHALIATPIIGLGVAMLGIVFYELTNHGSGNVLFSGESSLDSIVATGTGWSVGALILLVLFKGAAWGISMAGFRGGPAFPALFLGAALGIAASHLPGLSLTPAVAICMAAMFVSVLRLPLSAIVLTAMLTASAGIVGVTPLVIVGTVTAFLMTNLLTSYVPIASGD